MNEHVEERMKKLVRQALPPMNSDAGPGRDLWPDVLRRLDVNLAAKSGASFSHGWAWFDGVLAVGIVALVAIFPAAIPMFLYYF